MKWWKHGLYGVEDSERRNEMKKKIHYLVQPSKADDIKWLKPLTLSKAWKFYNKLRELNSPEVGGKFPRIIKVTTEYKTITK